MSKLHIHPNVKKWQSGIHHGALDFSKEWKLHLKPNQISHDIGRAFRKKTAVRPLSITIITIIALLIYGLGLLSQVMNINDQIFEVTKTYSLLYSALLILSMAGAWLIYRMKKIGVYVYVLSQIITLGLLFYYNTFDVWLGLMFIGFTAFYLYYFNVMD